MGTHRKTNVRPAAPRQWRRPRTRSRPESRPTTQQVARGPPPRWWARPATAARTLAGSDSPQVTWYPRWARHDGGGEPDVAGADHGRRHLVRRARSPGLTRRNRFWRAGRVAGHGAGARRGAGAGRPPRRARGAPTRRARPATPACPTGAARRCRGPSWRAAAPGAAGRAPRWRWARPGTDRARPPRAPPGRTRTTMVAPLLVTWNVPGRRSVASTASTPARSAVKVGLPRWSSTKRSGPGLLGQAQHGAHHVGAVRAAHPRRAHHGGPRVELVLAAELAAAVHRHRVGRVPLPVRAGRGAVEDVVGRDVDDMRHRPGAPPRRRGGSRGRSRRRRGRDRPHRRRPPSTPPACTIDVRAHRLEDVEHGGPVGDVESGVVGADDVARRTRCRGDRWTGRRGRPPVGTRPDRASTTIGDRAVRPAPVTSTLIGAGQARHRTEPGGVSAPGRGPVRRRPTRTRPPGPGPTAAPTSPGCSAYQRTVSARPSSKPTVGAQPSSFVILVQSRR